MKRSLDAADEDELVRRTAAGDRRAFDELYRRTSPWLLARLRRRCADDDLVADVLQETYLADRPYAEVAAELGIPESTLRSRVFYGLKALRLVMDEMEVAT